MVNTSTKPPKGGRPEKGEKPTKSTTEPRPAPAFVSSLRAEETDFPRGGGTSLTALEVKQTRTEGRREAEAEAQAESSKSAKKRKFQLSERHAKRLKKNEVSGSKDGDKDSIRVEHLNYKRLVTGTRVLARVHTVLPLHLILSLPNNLLAHVPITEVSNTLTRLLSQETSSSNGSQAESDDDTEAPDLTELFQPGQYYTAKVLNLFPTASQSFASQYPPSETNKLAARVEMTLVPEKVNSEIVKADIAGGYLISGEVVSEEDKGWRVGLGLSKENGLGGVEGWLTTKEASKFGADLLPGQIVQSVISSVTAGGRVLQLSVNRSLLAESQLTEVTNVGSLLPGHQVSALVTSVDAAGLNVQVCGFFEGTIDLAHLDLKEEDIEDQYKVGTKITARIIYDNLSTTPRRFALSTLPHVLSLSSPVLPGGSEPIEQAVEVGKTLQSVEVTRILPDWGVMCRTDDGLRGFAHISHLSDERLLALTNHTKQFSEGTLHRARVIGHSPLDGVALLSFEQKVLDQVFMQVDELQVGQVLKGTIRRLTDKSLFVDIHGSVDGVVYPLHYADIQLKHPERRFKPGGTVRCRVLIVEPARSRVVLTLKKSLVDSELSIPAHRDGLQTGALTPGVVAKILDKGLVVELFAGMKAFVPQSEASAQFTLDLKDLFYVGKSVNVRITELRPDEDKITASIRQALPAAVAAEKLNVGDVVSGMVSQIHTEQVVITILPAQLTALLSLSTLANHRKTGIDELRKDLKIGEKLEGLIVVSKNPTSGLLVLSTKRSNQTYGVSKPVVTFESLTPGEIVTGKVVAHTGSGTQIELPNGLKGRVHPCDAADDLSLIAAGKGPLNIGDEVKCNVLKVNPHTRIIDLSTRQSRVDPENAGDVVDREISSIDDLKEGQTLRGLVKNVTQHGLFVALGRSVVARIKIKELFDEFVKDWQSQFDNNQLVSGRILSLDHKRNFVELTLRKNSSSTKKVASLALSDFVEGQKVTATVKKVEAYGMFLKIDGSEVSGLCHKSEISNDKNRNVQKALGGFREGDAVKAKIIKIDNEKGKINFGIKPMYFDEQDEDDIDTAMQSDQEDGDEDDAEDILRLGSDDDEAEDGEADEDDDEEDEDEDDEEEVASDDEEEEGDVDVDMAVPPVSSTKSAKSKSANSGPAPTLNVSGGFDWSGRAPSPSPSAASESSDNEAEASTSRATKKGKSKASGAVDLTATAPDDSRPSSIPEFDRSLLASPNSSFLWIQYMSFHLQLHEVDKAREIGRRALAKINYREEEEKLNVWMALVNLEIGFGTEDSADKLFKEASSYNDARLVHMRYAEALQAAGKDDAVEEVFKKTVKKFGAYPDSWLKFAEYYLKKNDVVAARNLLPRSLKSLDRAQHVEMTQKMAVLEFRHGDAERGKTLFEGIVDRHPKKLDVWSVYIDQVAKTGDIQGVRGLFDRLLAMKQNTKRARFLFKKWLNIENRIGDAAGQERAKTQAREWVAANAAPADEDVDGDEEEEDGDDE